MDTVDRIRALCQKNGMSITKLEVALGYGNGSISKAGTNAMRSDRLMAIADYFGVTMEYLMTGKEETFDEASDRLETDAGYLFYLLKDMGYTFDSDADGHVIESFDKRRKYTLSGDQYEALSNLIENSGKAIISKFVFEQTKSEAVRESPKQSDQERELLRRFVLLDQNDRDKLSAYLDGLLAAEKYDKKELFA